MDKNVFVEHITMHKYLKYKQKYLQLKSLQIGGNKKTYTICSLDSDTNFFFVVLRRFLDEHGFSEVPQSKAETSNKIIDFLFFLDIHTFSKKIYQIQCKLKNELNHVSLLGNKCTLHKLINDSNNTKLQSYIPKTCDLMEVKHLEKGHILILRPCSPSSFGGKGIVRVTTDEQLQKEKRVYELNYKYPIIASEYIRNPLLFDSRKFHLRTYMLITLIPTFKYHLFKTSEIMTAKKPYIDDYFDDVEIHDTHCKSTEYSYIFPQDGDKLSVQTNLDDNIRHVWKQIDYICSQLSLYIKNSAKPYEESKFGYHLFGLDIVLDTSYNVFLIECNHHPGFSMCGKMTKKYEIFLNEFINWIYTLAIEPILY